MVVAKDSPQGWVIDSGVSRHMTPDESIFVTKRDINTTITVVNGEMLKARIIEDVRIDLGGQMVNMRDVLLVPGLDANLLSMSALNRKGFNVLIVLIIFIIFIFENSYGFCFTFLLIF